MYILLLTYFEEYYHIYGEEYAEKLDVKYSFL